jgi:hypothetical protein
LVEESEDEVVWGLTALKNFTTNSKFLTSRGVCPRLARSFVQNWRVLMRAMEKSTVEGMARRVIDFAKEFKPGDENVSHVVFL